METAIMQEINFVKRYISSFPINVYCGSLQINF